MQIALYPAMPTRPYNFCLSLQDGNVFADFNIDPDGRVCAVRISFDGYGCCSTPANVGRMNPLDSAMLLTKVRQGSIDPSAAKVLRAYFNENRNAFWVDALVSHDLL